MQTVRTSLALTCAQRLSHFARYQFDPNSTQSWQTADRLWRAALFARDANRGHEMVLPERAREAFR